MADTAGKRSGSGSESILKHITQERASAAAPGHEPRASRSQHTVLVVEDDPAKRYITVKLLQNAGFTTVETPSGNEALVLADSVAAVVLDVNLPDVNGVEVCAKLKGRESTAQLPVVLTSAVYVDDLHRDAGLASGADAYLIPPLDPEVLTSTLERLLGC